MFVSVWNFLLICMCFGYAGRKTDFKMAAGIFYVCTNLIILHLWLVTCIVTYIICILFLSLQVQASTWKIFLWFISALRKMILIIVCTNAYKDCPYKKFLMQIWLSWKVEIRCPKQKISKIQSFKKRAWGVLQNFLINKIWTDLTWGPHNLMQVWLSWNIGFRDSTQKYVYQKYVTFLCLVLCLDCI